MLKSVWRTVLKWLPAALRLTVIFFVLFLTSIPVRAEETVVRNVQYIDYTDGSEKKICTEAIDITSVSGKKIGNGKWYVVTGRHTIDKRFTVEGECNIIFRDDSAIYDNKGISCNKGNTLNLYSENYSHEGVFECDCTEDNCAAIGGDSGKSGGTINIHKMRLYVESNWGGAAIGGGKGGNSGNISIYNARIIAKGGLNAAAIGGGNQGRVTSISIYGGDIEAEARGSYWYDNNEYKGHAAAIGSGCDQPQGGPIHIENGWVEATSVNGAGIGSAEENNAGEILISGGSVFAYSYYGAGIGGGRYGNGGETIITGGFVNAMSFYTGAGIGGGQKGSGGYVYIDGGQTIASGGYLYITLSEAVGYNNYGQGWGRDHPYFNIIYSIIEGFVKAGDYGGAGIGGGDHGSGGEVVIAGGEVIASSSDEENGPWVNEAIQGFLDYGHAIGGGRGKGDGSLEIYDHLHVLVGKSEEEVESVLGPQRVEKARKAKFVHILPCTHPDGYEYTLVDDKVHTFYCKYCTENDEGTRERHTFNENGDCIYCGYGFYNVILYPNNGSNDPVIRETISKTEKYEVPECSFPAPEGKAFSHWLVKYLSHDHPDFNAVKGDKLDPPTSNRIVLMAQWIQSYNVWVSGFPVTEENKDDVLGDGGRVVFTPGGDGEGTLTLNDPAPMTGDYKDALIYADGIHLTVKGSAEVRAAEGRSPKEGIYVRNGSLTVQADNLEAYGSDIGIFVENGGLQVAPGALRVYAEGETAGILAEESIDIGDGLQIVRPVNGGIGHTVVAESNLLTVYDPAVPDPEVPDPETPDPEVPDPETPDPETPDPEVPDQDTVIPAKIVEIKAGLTTVTWNPGYEGPPPVTEEVPVGKTITIPRVTEKGFASPNGKVFLGWKKDVSSKAADDSGIYAPGDPYMVKENVSFTAMWGDEFPVWVNGIQITASNMSNVLGDEGTPTVSYNPETSTLTLNNPARMDGLHTPANAWIYARGVDLTIEGNADINVSHLPGSYGIAVDDGNLTLKTENLSVHSLQSAIFVADLESSKSCDLNILGGTLVAESNSNYAIHAVGGKLVIQDDPDGAGTVTRVEAAGGNSMYASEIIIGKTLEIVTPENGAVHSYGSGETIFDEEDKAAAHAVITRRQDQPDDPAEKYTVTYSLSGDIPYDVICPDPQTDLEAGTKVELADLPRTRETERDGVPGTYTFEGWTAPEGIEVEDNHFDMPEKDVEFTGIWTFTPTSYTVSFVDEDGETSLLAPAVYEFGTPVDRIRKPQDPRKPADEQYIYTFAGWEPPLAPVTEDVTYKAVYTAEESSDSEQYTVTFDSDGGTEVTPNPQIVKKGHTAERPENPEKEGFTFGTWTLDESAYDFSTPVTGDITLKAVWDALDPEDPGEYEVTDNIEDHIYEIYQIFTGDYAEMPNEDDQGTHPVLSNVVWGENGKYPEGLTKGDPVTEDILQSLVDVRDEEIDKDKLSEIEKYVDFNSEPVRKVQTDGSEPVSVMLPAGYYLIRDKNRSQTGRDDAYTTYITVIVKDYTIKPKSVLPSVDKQVSDGEIAYSEITSADNPTNKTPGVNGFYESADHAINESFQFRLAATLPASDRYVDYDEYKLVFHDTMSAGVTFESIESVKMGDLVLSDYAVEGVSAGEAGKEWTLTVILPKADDQSYSNLAGGTVVEVIYNAHLNENAIVHSQSAENTETNNNSVYLEYSNNPNVDINPEADYKDDTGQTEPDLVWVFTYGIDCVKKADSVNGTPLKGAGFTLYSGETAIKLTAGQQPGTWFVADQTLTEGVTTQMVTGEDGVFHLIGLDTGSYTLKETTTPGGYNTCEDVNVTITAKHGESVSTDSADLDLETSQLNYTIVNESGSRLPSTGGPGTKLFRLIGLLMILGAGVMLISRRRMTIE